MKHDKETYLRRIEMNLDNANYSAEKKAEIFAKLRINNMDKNIENYRWKSIRKYFLNDVDPLNIRFYTVIDLCSAVVIRNPETDTYSVAFSFIHPADINTYPFYDEYKKWTLINYIRGKFKYEGIKARSSINAICIAYNQNRSKFPKNRHLLPGQGLPKKIVPYLYLRDISSVAYDTPVQACDDITIQDIQNGILNRPEILDKLSTKYSLSKNKLKASGVDIREVRYYLTFPNMNCMVIRNNGKFTVTFSFMSPKESIVFKKFYNNPVDIVLSGKLTLIENYLANKFTYIVDDSNNSLSAVVRAFNSNKNKFPNKIYKRLKMDIKFVPALGTSENYYNELKAIKFMPDVTTQQTF